MTLQPFWPLKSPSGNMPIDSKNLSPVCLKAGSFVPPVCHSWVKQAAFRTWATGYDCLE